MKFLKDALLCLFLVSAIAVGAKLFVVLDRVDKAVFSLRGDLHELSESSSSTLVAATKAVNKVEQTSEEQRLYWKVISHDTARTIESANKLIENTDSSLNQVLVPRLALTLQSSDANLSLVARQTSDAIAHLDSGLLPVLVSSQKASQSLSERLDDPNLALTLRNLATGSQTLNNSLLNIQSGTQDIATAIHDFTHPKKRSFAYRSTLFLLNKSVPAAQLFSAIH